MNLYTENLLTFVAHIQISSTTDSSGFRKPSLDSPCNSLPKHAHTVHLVHHPQIKICREELFHIDFSIVKRYTRKYKMKFTTIYIK